MDQMKQPSKKKVKRPVSLVILCVLSILVGFVSAFLGLVEIAAQGTLTLTGSTAVIVSGETVGVSPMVMAVLHFLIGALEFTFGIGALFLLPWAWMLGLGIVALNLVYDVLGLTHVGAGGAQVVNILISLAILGYLLSGDIRLAFRR
jgi:hypothetical protein